LITAHRMPQYLLWLDFESIDLEYDGPQLEVGVKLTDTDLNVLARYETLIRPPEELLALLEENPFVLKMHTKSGLLAELLSAPRESLPMIGDVEVELLDMIEHYVGNAQVALAGTGVGHHDMNVLAVQMPTLHGRVTYWQMDLGPSRREYEFVTGGPLTAEPEGGIAHRAMADIRYAMEQYAAFAHMYRMDALAKKAAAVQSGAPERALIGLSLIDAFREHAVIDTDAGEVVRTDTADEMAALYALTSDQSHMAGLMDAGARLLEAAAQASGVSADEIVGRVRQNVLADAAQTA